MAWWTDTIFDRNRHEFRVNQKEETLLVVFWRALRQYLREKIVDILFIILGAFIYFYLSITLATFFFYDYVPYSFHFIVRAFSDPYLGALGVYILAKEVERRWGRIRKRRHELFVAAWVLFLFAATGFYLVAYDRNLADVYEVIITSASAAVLLRIGTFLRIFLP